MSTKSGAGSISEPKSHTSRFPPNIPENTNIPIPTRSDPIPKFKIDLSLPPSERYVEVATHFRPLMHNLTPLFDEVLRPAFPAKWVRNLIRFFAMLFLRRLYSREETEEIKGISKATGVDLYFLVALNVFIDSMLGCTSGAAMTQLKGKRKGMLHFRTLDWGMDSLRSVLVELEFLRSGSENPERIIARTITYAGFVEVLTGVRHDLSVSLNFRPNHSCSTLKLRMHQLAILFGFKPSIAHILRTAIFPESTPPPLEELASSLSIQKSAPCYFTLCDGTTATVLEKDLQDARIRSSNEFIIHTNHDTEPLSPTDITQSATGKALTISGLMDDLGMDAFLDDSRQRRACVQEKWNALKVRQWRKQRLSGVEGKDMVGPCVAEKTLVNWVQKYPTMNEQSHFGCVMDPSTGTVVWIERGEYEEGESTSGSPSE